MSDIRIKDLPLATGGTAPVGTDAVAIDGLTTRRTTITALGNVAVPIASQATAEAGVNATERMTPLTTKQSIASEVGVTIASAAEGDLASTALQPGDAATPAQGVKADAALPRNEYAFFDTEALFQAATIPLTLNEIRTNGYYAAGDGGGHSKNRIPTPSPVEAWHKQSADGAWWEISREQNIFVDMFGAKRYTEADLIALGRTSIPCHNEFQNCLDFMNYLGGGVAYCYSGFYIWESGVRPKKNTGFYGYGYGAFPPNFPTEPKTWGGTNILLRDSFPKEALEFGVTSMKKSGGWIADPDNPSRIFKLSSLSEGNATGTTPASTKEYSIGLKNQDHDTPFMCGNFRICPWIGSDGYSNYSLTTGSDLGDDIDICLCVNDAENSILENIQVRGYARAFGTLMLSAGYSREGRCEGNILRKVSSQGFVGLGIRAGDVWAVLSTSSSSLEIPWTDESYWPTSGSFEGLQNGTDYNYASLSRNGDNLVFNGVSPDPSGTTQIRNPLRGTGWSTTILENCEGWGLYHHSDQTAEQLGLGISKAGEISGFPMRGINGLNNSFFGESDSAICFFFHDCDDIDFMGGKFETGHLIASPLDAPSATVRNPIATNPQGATTNLRFGVYSSSSTDTRLFLPRSINWNQSQFNPSTRLSPNLLIEALVGQDWQARIAASKNFQVLNSSGSSIFSITDSGNASISGSFSVGSSGSSGIISGPTGQGVNIRSGSTNLLQLLSSGTLAPGAAGANFGTNTLPFGAGYFQQMRISDGIPTPATLSGYAILFVDSADGDLKIKFGDGVVKTIVTDT